MSKASIICFLIFGSLCASVFGQQQQEVQVNNALDLGDLKEPINELIGSCSYFLPMVESYIRAQSNNPEFLIGGTDLIALQVAVDSSFNACETILNVIAAYQLVISDYSS